MFTVAIAENQYMFREFLVNLINSFDEFQVIYDVRDGAALIDKVQESVPPQILILDLEMPVMNGYQTALWFKEHCPDTKILVLSMYGSELVMIKLLKRGVRAYLNKDFDTLELRKAMLHLTTEGSCYLANKDTAELLKYFDNGRQIDKSLLDDREIQFVKYACTADTLKDIADKMSLSERTVSSIQADVLKKLGVENRVKLVAYALNSGILNL